MVRRTERIWLKPSFNLMQYSHKSKNLYNQANYIFKKQLQLHHFTSSFELMDILRHHPTYTALPAHTAQQIIKFLVKNWKSYFKALKVYKIDPSKFKDKPRPPNYKRRAGFHLLYFTNNQIRIIDGFIHFPRLMNLKVKTRLDKVEAARILPRGSRFLLELIYDKEVPNLRPVKNIIAVDFGLNNIITGVSTNNKPIIINGKPLKSYNQWFNKEKARLSSIYKIQSPGAKYLRYGVAMLHLLDKKYKKTEDYLHKISRRFIDYCTKHLIDTIVIGYNEGWKQDINIGKVNNQNFVGIAYLNLLRKIEYKAEDNGIRIIRQEESYTSECSFIDNEVIKKHRKYLGRRMKRGLFKSKKEILLNADANAAGNIGRKVFPMQFCYGIVDAVSHPVSLYV